VPLERLDEPDPLVAPRVRFLAPDDEPDFEPFPFEPLDRDELLLRRVPDEPDEPDERDDEPDDFEVESSRSDFAPAPRVNRPVLSRGR